MITLQVTAQAPVRLDKYLLQQFPQLGLGRLNKALRENKIKLNGKKQPFATRIQEGDEIQLYFPAAWLSPGELYEGLAFMAARCAAAPVYEDAHILLVQKPAGLPVQAPSGQDSLLARALRYLYEQGCYTPGQSNFEPCLCHRLDTGTSGLVLLAKTAIGEQLITGLIRERRLQKQYLCVTFGRPSPTQATLRAHLSKDSEKGVVRILPKALPGTKPIETRYETLAVSGRLALLQVDLITGRTHQIRAHLASIGCPILGDSKYGNHAANREMKLKYQALCAWKLQFPVCGQPELAGVSGRAFYAEEPWYYRQILDGTLK